MVFIFCLSRRGCKNFVMKFLFASVVAWLFGRWKSRLFILMKFRCFAFESKVVWGLKRWQRLTYSFLLIVIIISRRRGVLNVWNSARWKRSMFCAFFLKITAIVLKWWDDGRQSIERNSLLIRIVAVNLWLYLLIRGIANYFCHWRVVNVHSGKSFFLRKENTHQVITMSHFDGSWVGVLSKFRCSNRYGSVTVKEPTLIWFIFCDLLMPAIRVSLKMFCSMLIGSASVNRFLQSRALEVIWRQRW